MLPPTSTPDAAAGDAGWVAARWALLAAWVDRQQAALAIKDAESGRYVEVNAAMAALLTRAADDIVGGTDVELFGADVAHLLRAADRAVVAAPDVASVSEHRFDLHGQRREFAVLRLVHTSPDGRRWLASLWSDLGPQRQKEAQLRQALEQLEQQQHANAQLRGELLEQRGGLRDTATGLYNRAHFDDLLKREVDLSNREHREFALVSIALDPPSAEVAALGAPARRALLAAVGRLLRGNTRAMDASCHLEEGRFAVLLSGVGLATAHSRMEQLRRQCATQIVMLDGRELGFTVSMGVASFPHTAHTLEELLAACHDALAEARRRGGNHVSLASIRFERP